MNCSMRLLATAATLVLFVSSLSAAEPKDLLLTSFEDGPGPVKGDGQIVAENPSEGTKSYKLENKGGGYTGIWIEDAATLKKFKDYVLFKVDIYNPGREPIQMNVRVDDAKSNGFGSRFNDERNAVAGPGWTTYELNLTGLTKSNSKNYFAKEKLDIENLTLVKIFIGGGVKVPLYFDNLRLEPAAPPVEGLKAFDFGPSKSEVYPGFEGAGEKNVWKDKDVEFGWVNPTNFDNVYIPDSLAGDYGSGDEFRVRLPNGSYEVDLCMDPFGIWGSYPRFGYRKLSLCGKEVSSEKMTMQEFLNKCYFLYENEEDLPGQDLWEKFVTPRNVPRHFTCEVTDGVLSVKLDSDTKYGKFLQYLVVYPSAKKAEGKAWMDALQKKRKDKFNKKMIVRVPWIAPPTPAPADTAEEKARGFKLFSKSAEEFIYVNEFPYLEKDQPIKVQAAQGERVSAQFGMYPLKDVKGLYFTPTDLVSKDGKSIPAKYVHLRIVRNFLQREHRYTIGSIMPMLLQDFPPLDSPRSSSLQPWDVCGPFNLTRGVTRAIWVTLTVPADATAGDYKGRVDITAGGPNATVVTGVPIEVKVFPFALDKVTDVTFSATGARSTIPEYFQSSEEYWAGADAVMKDMADHGLNAVTGGPGGKFYGIKGFDDPKADIDFTDMDRWMELAKKYGLTMPGDSYQGFDIGGLPKDHSKNGPANMDKIAREKYGMSFEKLIGLVYNQVEEHAKAKGWPKRSYYFLDEPRVEFGNIESSLELIKLYTKAAPNTLFSGYYGDGQGRDEYFKLMPVSISHVNDNILKLVKESGKQLWVYDGSRNRASIGRWMFAAAKAGVKGYLTNGYMYVCSDPYFDFSDDEAAWCVAWPGKYGVVDTVQYERVADGINDYRYLITLERLVKTAPADKPTAATRDALKFLADTLAAIDIHKSGTAALTPEKYAEFRAEVAKLITDLKKESGEK